MVLIRSTFWLVIAFMIISPQIDVSNLSDNALNSTQRLIESQTDLGGCQSLECAGSKLVISAGLQVASDAAQSLSQSSQAPVRVIDSLDTSLTLTFPFPHPRLIRAS